jgi:hypothetical protein
MTKDLESLRFENQGCQPARRLSLMLLARGPEDCLARRDRLELAVRAADTPVTLEHRQDLRNRRRVTRDPSVWRDAEDCRLDRRSSGQWWGQRSDADTVEKAVPWSERDVRAEAQSFQLTLLPIISVTL